MKKQRNDAGGSAGIVFSFMLMLFCACSLAQDNTTANLKSTFRASLTPGEVEWLVHHRQIRVQNEQDSVPYNFYKNGPQGYSVDYINLLADIIGIDVVFVSGPSWSEFLSMMENKQLDVMANIVNIEARRDFITFTKPYQKLLEGIYIKQGGEQFKSLEQLRGRKVAIVRGFYQHPLIKKHYPDIELVLVDSNIAAIEAVLSSKVDATFSDSALINHLLRENTVGGIVLSSFNQDKRFENVVSLGVRKDWPIFRDILQKAMDVIPTNRLDQLHAKWHGESGTVIKPSRSKQVTTNAHSGFLARLLSVNTLITIVVLAVAITIMILLMTRLLMRSKRNPMAFQFSSPTSKRIMVLLNVLLIVSASILAWWALETIQTKIKENVRDSLRTVVRTTLETIEIWAKDQKLSVRNIAMDPQIRTLAHQQLLDFRGGRLRFDNHHNNDLADRFNYLQDRSANLDYVLVTADGVILTAAFDDLKGKISPIYKHRPQLFRKVLNGETLLIPPVPAAIPLSIGANITGLGRPSTMFVATPAKDPHGRIYGVIAQRLNPAAEFSQLHLLGRMGESGETYSFDQNGKMLSNSRFNADLLSVGLIEQGDQSILSVDVRDPGGNLLTGHQNPQPIEQWPLTLMAQMAINQGKGWNVEGYRDYRGVKVFAAWVWSHEEGFGITTEIDQQEAMEPYVIARLAIIITLLVTVCVAMMFSTFVMVLGNRANQALHQAREQLELEVQSRTRELRGALSDIDEQRHVLDQHAIVAVTDLRGTITYANQRFAEISGYEIDELIGKNHRILNSGYHDEAFWRQMYDVVKSGGVWHEEVCNKAKNGALYWVETTIASLKDENGRPKAYVAIRTDISGRKRYEKELEEAKENAELANQAKSDFLASMSHEIRTPLNGILGMLGLVTKSALDQEQQHRLGVASSCAQSLLTIINDILDFSKIEAGKLDLEQIDFDLVDLLEDIARSQAYQCTEKNLELLLDISKLKHCNVVGDPNRVRQILFNLIGNAVKFTQQGEVRIEAELSELDEGRLLFICNVKDTGIGIPPDRVDALFDSFTQVDTSTTRKYGGTGLGLAICKRLCQLMYGDIKVTSKLGMGSCFTFSLVFNVSSQTHHPLIKVDISALNILIVDDNAGNREIVGGQLRSWGAQVSDVENVPLAIELLEGNVEKRFDVVLVDMNMPNMDGELLTTYIRSNAKYDELKIILMNEVAQLKRVEALNTIGLNGFLIKPVSVSDLHDVLLPIAAGESQEKMPFLLSATAKNDKAALPSSQVMENGLRILMVEDNEINQLVVGGMLQQVGLSCDTAINGVEALRLLKNDSHEQPYDLVLMDCQMPVLDGYQTTEKIRAGEAGERYADITIVALTANAMVSDKQKCLDIGMNDYLAKPVDENKLIGVLKKWQQQLADKKQPEPGDAEVAEEPLAVNDDAVRLPTDLTLFNSDSNSFMLLNHKGAFVKSLNLYIKQYADFDRQIAEVENDNVKLSNLIHTIKGIGGNLQLSKIYQQCKDIEQKSREQGRFDDEMLVQLAALVAMSIDEARRIVALNCELTKVTDFRPLQTIKTELLQKLGESELINQSLIDEFKASAAAEQTHLAVDDIVAAMDIFDYDKALDLLTAHNIPQRQLDTD